MQLAPFIEVRIDRFGRWRAALAIVAVMSAVVASTWCWQAMAEQGTPAWQLVLVVSGLIVSMILCGQQMLMADASRPVELRWDGQCWWLGAVSGDMSVALDFGGWLLLKFRPVDDEARHATWLPVQRGGLESKWHALRCAVYSTRPPTAGSPSIHAATPDPTT